MRIRPKQHLAEAEINLTPLIDVCFTILIMFIVVAPLLETENIQLCSGSGCHQENLSSVQEKSPIAIHVYSDDSVTINHQKILITQLEEFLHISKKNHPTATPQLFHDCNAKFGTYQAIKNAVESAGFPEIELILKP